MYTHTHIHTAASLIPIKWALCVSAVMDCLAPAPPARLTHTDQPTFWWWGFRANANCPSQLLQKYSLPLPKQVRESYKWNKIISDFHPCLRSAEERTREWYEVDCCLKYLIFSVEAHSAFLNKCNCCAGQFLLSRCIIDNYGQRSKQVRFPVFGI